MGYTLPRIARIGFSTALLVALSTAACVDNNTTLFIQQVQAISATNSCEATADPTAAFWSSGTMDLALTAEYNAMLLVGNQLVSRGNADTMRPESARVQLYSADVSVFDAGGGTVGEFSLPVAGFVDVGTGDTPGYGLVHVPLIDAGTSAAIAPGQTVVARVKIYGSTLGGIDVETGYYDFPIVVCQGCIACTCPSSADSEYVVACQAGQNEGIDCRNDTCYSAANNWCSCTAPV
jgi:hypothetical protein